MIQLTKAVTAWGSNLFAETLKQEILRLDTGLLPLQQGMTYGNHASDENLTVMILNVSDDKHSIHAKTGIFFTGIISGCQCADDPSPDNQQPEYCEVMFDINKETAETVMHLLSD
jgi:hypothetical protein